MGNTSPRAEEKITEGVVIYDEAVARDRMTAAIWGMFIGDALGMPVHWYYNPDKLKEAYGYVTDYSDAKHPHVESFLSGMSYYGTIDILHENKKFYKTRLDLATGKDDPKEEEKEKPAEEVPTGDAKAEEIPAKESEDAPTEESEDAPTEEPEEAPTEESEEPPESEEATKPEKKSASSMEHGCTVPEEAYHYHHGMKAGDNTVDMSLVRVLMRTCVDRKGYMNDWFLEAFKEYMTTPGINTDIYTSMYLRKFFENASRGLELYNCAQRQYENWSVIHSSGTFGAFLVAFLNHKRPTQAVARGIQHHSTTHRAENLTMALVVLLPLLLDLVSGADPEKRIRKASKQVYMPKLSGQEIRDAYRAAKGPGNIPRDDMWKIHTELQDKPMDIDKYLDHDDLDFLRNVTSTICYTEFSVPAVMYLGVKYANNFEKAILTSTNVGGDTCGRNGILGAVMGASVGMAGIPERFLTGLIHHDEMKAEIDGFVDLCFA